MKEREVLLGCSCHVHVLMFLFFSLSFVLSFFDFIDHVRFFIDLSLCGGDCKRPSIVLMFT